MHITKMHGLGNDFIVLEETEVCGQDIPSLARRLCVRRLGVGADGLLIVGESDRADVRMRIINSDGSEAEMCGNGIRCFARYVYDKGIVTTQEMSVETLAGVMRPELVLEGGSVKAVCVDMGKPSFEPEEIPVTAKDPLDFTVYTSRGSLKAASVLMGVPHTVILVDNVGSFDVDAYGPEVEANECFPRRTNVDFVQLLGDGRSVRMETWERGAGRTLACGTGATATGIVLYRKGLCGKETDIHVSAGTLHIENMSDGRAFMTGPAAYVFSGEV
ncbi:MAG: diaminopimelate epimerase [Christensenella sp.]|nr:diaminopimelate epimerase [Christensenella sp.]